jgi:hypothetical protein
LGPLLLNSSRVVGAVAVNKNENGVNDCVEILSLEVAVKPWLTSDPAETTPALVRPERDAVTKEI